MSVSLSIDFLNNCSSRWLHAWCVHCLGPKEVQCRVWSSIDEQFLRAIKRETLPCITEFNWQMVTMLGLGQLIALISVIDYNNSVSQRWLRQVKAWIPLHNRLQLKDLSHNHLKCGTILNQDPTVWCSVSSVNWELLIRAVQELLLNTKGELCQDCSDSKPASSYLIFVPSMILLLGLSIQRTCFCY